MLSSWQAGGKFAESGEFFELLFIAGDFADPVGKKSDEALADTGIRWNIS